MIVGPTCVLTWVGLKIATTRYKGDRVESPDGLAALAVVLAVFRIPLWPAGFLLLDGRVREFRAIKAAAKVRRNLNAAGRADS